MNADAPDISRLDADDAATALDRAARVGYAAKGIAYVLMAAFSFVALEAGEEAAGQTDVLDELAGMPLGTVLLAAMAAGLAAYGVWRLVGSALLPADGKRGVKAVAERLGYAASGATHLLIAVYAGALAFGVRLGSRGGESTEQTLSERVLSLPGGGFVLGALGLAFFATAAVQLVKGFRDDPLEPHRTHMMSERERRLARLVARAGLAARAVVFTVIGLGLVAAAWQSDAGEVRGLGDALGSLAAQPYGDVLFGAVAVGFVAYAAYCASLARYARFGTSLDRSAHGS